MIAGLVGNVMRDHAEVLQHVVDITHDRPRGVTVHECQRKPERRTKCRLAIALILYSVFDSAPKIGLNLTVNRENISHSFTFRFAPGGNAGVATASHKAIRHAWAVIFKRFAKTITRL